jgi:GNAT superfamily N-acetyltransferase
MRSFEPADTTREFDGIAALHLEYFSWAGQKFSELYDVSLTGVLGAPLAVIVELMVEHLGSRDSSEGAFYLVRIDGRLAGMGGLHRLGERVSELTRIYLRPEFRGAGHGEALVKQLIEDAGSCGDIALFLSSARFMRSAHRIYEAHGFVDCAVYEGAEIPPPLIPHMRFMRREFLGRGR